MKDLTPGFTEGAQMKDLTPGLSDHQTPKKDASVKDLTPGY
jgi:hypothetical protein